MEDLMAADGNLLQGEIIDDPEGEEKDVEMLLTSFLKALLLEQGDALRPVAEPIREALK